MTNVRRGPAVDLPPPQRAIRDRCFHPTGEFIPFSSGALDAPLQRRFEEQVQRAPGRLAIQTRRHAFTYGELNALANRIAHAVARHPSGTDSPVALLFGHEALAIAAMLGVLKAGRLYVALDPAYPRQRLEHILHDSTARLLLTEHGRAPEAHALAAGDLSVCDVESVAGSADDLDCVTIPRSAAFILYTSGSTGQPKGIIQTHANVLHDVWHYTNSGHFCADDRFLLVSSISFADSVRTIYSSLLNGAALFPFDLHVEGLATLAGWIIEQRLTIYRSVPTVFRHFVRSLSSDAQFDSLRLVYLAGEPVRWTDVEAYQRVFPRSCVLVNRLGTTETLTFRVYFIDHDVARAGGVVPVGYAVPDHELFLLDEHGQQVPVGAVGEMAVRSRYLSPGFWRRPDLSESRFSADPVDPELRTYRTGDLGRLTADGCLEHLGRKDFQVKIRGHRIETAEVEAALLDLGCIREAAVVAQRRVLDDRLVAYVVPTAFPAPSSGTLRVLLSARLPEYMVPSSYVVLDALPLLPNGKLNRQALPPVPQLGADSGKPAMQPRHFIEEEIARLWREVLDIEVVGIHDNFIDLGGDSLTASRILARLRDRFGLEIPLPMLWQAPTVAMMAALVRRYLEGAGAPLA